MRMGMEKVKSEEKKRCRNVSCGSRFEREEKNMKSRNYSISYYSKLSGGVVSHINNLVIVP